MRSMKTIALACALFFAAPALAQTAAPVQPAPPVPATAMTPTPDDRAKQWLTLLDDGNYAEAWKQAGTSLRAKITAESFGHDVGAVRAPLGAMASRNLKDVKMSKTAPGMPDGQYATIRYDSAFAHKAAAVETLTLSSDKDGWSVVGYHIN
jgi:hypothetical protein